MHEPGAANDDLRLHLLVLRCQAGDEAAFAALFENFGHRTLAHLRSLVGDAADDVHQDVWLTVYRQIRGLTNPGAFRTWLFRTTRHRAIDYLRRRRRDRELIDDLTPIDEAAEPAQNVVEPVIDATTIDWGVANLPPLQREAVLLRYRDELSYADIALVAGCPIGTVRTRLHHAKKRLHALLAKE